ncbi:hypothetical protein [Streptomyces sp. NPDC004533]|uniref:hypothetical protein n=1 Tax=Streptomyces sp. NPDC004533 TaxID=3154278 RepID=UPI00339E3750
MHDTAGGKLRLNDLSAAHPSVTKVWAEGRYQSSIFNHDARLGNDVELMQRPQPKGADEQVPTHVTLWSDFHPDGGRSTRVRPCPG